MKTCTLLTIAAISFGMCACNSQNGEYDAAGTFEATEILVSSQANGTIQSFTIHEGQELKANEAIGCIDSMQLYLRKKQILTAIRATECRRPEVHTQIAVIEQQIATLTVEKKRVETLLKANAANQKQLDDINAQLSLVQKQLDAQQSSLTVTINGITEDVAGLKVQIEQIDDQLQKCRITNPIDGTVLVKYAETNELAVQGKPLYKIADVQNMIFRAYITANQLTQLKLGQEVTIYADFGDDSRPYKGRVDWISSKSEFTPKTIQTKDERANLVYAVKVAVQNDGYLKIGMYGHVNLNLAQ